ncbi:MAG: hypothetical protein V2A70_00390 [Candidatus Omnitrophota bacterium]
MCIWCIYSIGAWCVFDMAMIKERLRGILNKNFKSKAHLIERLADNEDFVKRNLFDSFELIKVVLLIETEFGIAIETADLANESLNSLDKIEHFVTVKQGGK